jgi:ankyrin repeat protein
MRHSDTLELLVNKGAELNIQDCGGSTALHYASATGNAEIVDLLSCLGADPHVEDGTGSTALRSSVEVSRSYGMGCD